MFNIALYQPDIPQNTAAIIRLCSCFDTTLEIIEPCGFHLDDKRLKELLWIIWIKAK
jgi:tRNA (cytidine/uridine-2'-O-)-methyltransferase